MELWVMIQKKWQTNLSVKRKTLNSPWSLTQDSYNNLLWFKGYVGMTRGAYITNNVKAKSKKAYLIPNNLAKKKKRNLLESSDLPLIIEINKAT